MLKNQPTSFHGTPSYGAHHPGPTPSAEPVGPVARVVLPRSVPTLTVYPDGLVNLNGDATRALGKAEAVALAAPSSPGGHWLLLPVPADHPGALTLYTNSQGGGRRFRAVALATAVFALLPEAQKNLAFGLTPVGGMFRLVVS